MKINWGDYILTDNKFLVSRADLSSRVRDYFGTGSQVVTVSPDSLRLNYTTSPGRRVVVKVVADFQPSFGNIISGRYFISDEPLSRTLTFITCGTSVIIVTLSGTSTSSTGTSISSCTSLLRVRRSQNT